MTRRLLIKALGAAPALMASRSTALPCEIESLIHQYDPDMGDLGSGHRMPAEKIVKVTKSLLEIGFVPYTVPGRYGFDAQYLQVYAASGNPKNAIWFGFHREVGGVCQMVAFESTPMEIKRMLEIM